MARTPTSTPFSPLGLISLLALCAACGDDCHCDGQGQLPQRWVFVNESDESLTLSWFEEWALNDSRGQAITATFGPGESCAIDTYGSLDGGSFNTLDSCLRDAQSDHLTLTVCDSTFYVIAPYKVVHPGSEQYLYVSYTARWLLRNRRVSEDRGQEVWTWRLTAEALDSLAAQARRAGLTPTHNTQP